MTNIFLLVLLSFVVLPFVSSATPLQRAIPICQVATLSSGCLDHDPPGIGDRAYAVDASTNSTCSTAAAPTALAADRYFNLCHYSATGWEMEASIGAPTPERCITIEAPVAGESFTLFRVSDAATVMRLDCISIGGTSSTVEVTLQECNANAGSCVTIHVLTCAMTNTSATQATPFDQDPAVVDAGDWLKVLVGTNTGVATQLGLCMSYRNN